MKKNNINNNNNVFRIEDNRKLKTLMFGIVECTNKRGRMVEG